MSQKTKKGKPRDKKTVEVVDRAIVRKAKKEPFMSSSNILNEISCQFKFKFLNF